MTSIATTATAPPTPSRPFPWTPILALTIGTLLTVTAELLPAGLLVEIGADTGVETSSVGYLVTAWGVAIAAFSLPLTRATSRLDRRAVLLGSLAVAGLGTLLTAFAPSYGVLVAARMLAAAGHGLFWSQVVVVASALAGAVHAGRAIAVVVAGPTIATVAAVPAFTALGEQAGWRPAFALIGVLAMGAAALLPSALPRLAPADPVEAGHRDASVPPVVTAAVLGAVVLAAHFAAFTFVGPVLVAANGPTTSVALVVFGATGIAGLLLAPAFVRRFPQLALPATGVALSASLLGVAWSTGPFAVLLAVGAWGVVLGGLPVVFQTRLLALASDAFRPMTGAVMVVSLNLGIAAGAALGAVAHRIVGAADLPSIAAGVALVAGVGLAWTADDGRRSLLDRGNTSR